MDDVTNATNEPSRHSETPRRTRRGGKRIRLKNAPKPAMAVKALWEQASAEDKERAKRQGAAILELWLGRKSKEALALELSMPPLRVWQMSQMAFSGLLAGLLKQPRSWTGAPPPEPVERAEASRLRKELAEARSELERERRLTNVLKQLASVKGSTSTSVTTSRPSGKKRGTSTRSRQSRADRPRAQRGSRPSGLADEGGVAGAGPQRP